MIGAVELVSLVQTHYPLDLALFKVNFLSLNAFICSFHLNLTFTFSSVQVVHLQIGLLERDTGGK